MEPAAPAATLVIPDDLSALRPMSEWLARELQGLQATPQQLFNFDLCANEAVANVMSYGHPVPGQHEIVLRLRGEPGVISLEIEDEGVAYNPLERPPHVQPTDLEDAAIGGLGVDLIRDLMDECHYVRTPAGRNLLRLLVRVRGSA